MILVSINEIQDEVMSEISKMNGDIEMLLLYIVGSGQILPTMPVEHKSEENIIKGCHSNVWLAAVERNDTMHFYADSDSIISKGLISLLIRIYNNQRRDDILTSDLFFIRQDQLKRFIGTKRSNGFAAMIDQMKCWSKRQG
jgi:cysteine desulfuration protein SufE